MRVAPASGAATKSDKKYGVVALVHLDLRARGKVGRRVALCGTSGEKMPAIRQHLREGLGAAYCNLSPEVETFPADDVKRDERAYLSAMNTMRAGDIVSVFTPDNTHFEVIMAAVERGLHVMGTKPLVMTLEHHRAVVAAARRKRVLVQVEVHKRFDPIYADARERIRKLGDFGFFSSYMSQPRHQLHTFAAWAGRGSDISYYLNSHHIDFHCWALQGLARPERVTAAAATGVCKATLDVDAEDTIALTVEWRNLGSGSKGVALYTASWAAPKSDVHSQQRFHYLAHRGEVAVDQAHRGYSMAADDTSGLASLNPLYMRYTPDARGRFVGQSGYGYVSFERFVDAVQRVRAGADPAEFDDELPTAAATLLVTAVLEAGRRSLDARGAAVRIVYGADGQPERLEREPA
jgi:D-galacturonate reductase